MNTKSLARVGVSDGEFGFGANPAYIENSQIPMTTPKHRPDLSHFSLRQSAFIPMNGIERLTIRFVYCNITNVFDKMGTS